MIISEERYEEIEKLVSESLGVMENIAAAATKDIQRIRKQKPENALFMRNTWNENACEKFNAINATNISDLDKLIKEPIIARVSVETEEGKKADYYISRSNPLASNDLQVKVASYKAPMGRLASVPPGDEVEIRTGTGAKYFTVLERTRYQPKFEKQWDSINSLIEKEGHRLLTIESFRRFLDGNKELEEPIKDLLSDLLIKEMQSDNVYEGTRKSIIHRMSLRDQPVLDRYQDEIFRLPIDNQLLIVGPPGTGKTTTLIRRLGQKIDTTFLSEDEKIALDIVQDETRLDHKNSWVMFTPTELLKQYLKEAFNREGVPAPEARIRTWDNYRHYLSRDILNILKSGTGSGTFILNNSNNTLHVNTVDNTIEWYEAFSSFFNSNTIQKIKEALNWLKENLKDDGDIDLIKQIQKNIRKEKEKINAGDIVALNRLNSEILTKSNKYKTEIKDVIDSKLNQLLNREKQFLDELVTFIDSLIEDVFEDNEDEDENDDLEIDQTPKHSKGRRLEAYNDYSRCMRTLAKAIIERKKPSSNTKTGRILNWLGDRILKEDELKKIGISLNIQQRLRILSNPLKLYINEVPNQYKKFRKKCAKQNEWYDGNYIFNEVNCFELDIILLLMLKNINGLINSQTFPGLWESQ